MISVTQHFDVEEFACHEGTPYPISQMDTDDPSHRSWYVTRLLQLCLLLETLRAETGGLPIHIDSGYRTLEYDQKIYEASAKDGSVAPASRSQHPQGRAADITHPTLSPVEIFNTALQLYRDGKLPMLGGIGLYPNFVHVDVRANTGHLAIWGGDRPSNIA